MCRFSLPGTFQGYVGNGQKCVGKHSTQVFEDTETGALTFISSDGTIETDVSKACGCSKPVRRGHCKNSDCCGGGLPCNEECRPDGNGCDCKEDFERTMVAGGAYRCVDPTPPMVRLLTPTGSLMPVAQHYSEVKVKQCKVYEDPGYDIDDDNKDTDMRKFEMSASIPSGCLVPNHRDPLPLPTYNITFRTWTGPESDPWSSHSVTRVVRVVDTNECVMTDDDKRSCPDCAPKCHASARCANKIGSYGCKCPMCGQKGDGFSAIGDPSLQPLTYVNGSGCLDSCPPEITLQGSSLVVFKVCKCDGPLCGPSEETVDWASRLNAALEASPDSLCPSGSRSPCAVALDPTMSGIGTRDISSRIVVGDPIHLSGLSWKIPYDVSDEAGNAAATVFREVGGSRKPGNAATFRCAWGGGVAALL